jgi:hypothetical protein
MKLKHIISITALFFITGNMDAQQPAFLDMAVNQPDNAALKFRVQIVNPEQQKVTLSVNGKNEGPLAVRTFSDNNFFIVFDLSTLEDGEYVIEAKTGKQRLQKNIVIRTFSRVERVASVNTEKRLRPLAF